jgi:hypothetical protein
LETLATVAEEEAAPLRRVLEELEALEREARPVKILVPGAGVYICEGCVEACVEYIEMKRSGRLG